MNDTKRKMIEGWIEKASNRLQSTRDHLKGYGRHSEAIQDSQECIELAVKSVLEILEVEYAPRHGWTRDEFKNILRQVAKRHLMDVLSRENLGHSVRLPRLLLLANFWSHFYIPAKYGFEEGYLASARDLFTKEEAELSAKHAEECYRAASTLRYLPPDKLSAILNGLGAAGT